MATSYVSAGAVPIVGTPDIRRIGTNDLREALALGYADFLAMPSHLAFLCLIYPILGIVLASVAFGYDLLPLVFPLISGFALIGPLAGIGLYELSRRRERGQTPRWRQAFEVVRSPAIGSIVGMGLVLVAIFALWILTAHAIFGAILGSVPAPSYDELLRTILTTRQGWTLIVVGDAVGLAFAVLVLAISVIAFPLILDREAGIGTAIAASIKSVEVNPRTMAVWGLIVAALLALGSIPLFVGLAVVMPVLGHATWHLYRKVVAS